MKQIAVGIAIFLAILMLVPMFLTVSMSLKGRDEGLGAPNRVIPRLPTLESYRQLFNYKPVNAKENPFAYRYPLPKWFLNTTILAIAGAVSTTIVALMMAFALAKYRFPGRRVVEALVILSLVIPGQIVFVQRFVLVRNLGLYNTLLAVIIPGIVSASSIWFLMQYMRSIPEDFIDMGRLDGLGAYGLLGRVVAPMCTPAIAALLAMSLVGVWGDYLWPLVVLRKPELYTIALGVREVIVYDFLTRPDANPGLAFAGATLAMLPGLVLFLCFQKYFVSGLFAKGASK